MKIAKTFLNGWIVFATLLIASWFCISPSTMEAQQGDNAVYLSSASVQPSTAFIDASAFCTGGCGAGTSDVCSMISAALPSIPSAGGVIDARGVVLSGGGSQNCPVAANPFAILPLNNLKPITVLLPASTINLATSGWILPSNVHLIGEGEITILAATFSSGAIIEMGYPVSGCATSGSPVACSGVSIEHLKLSGPASSNSLTGIVNNYAQQASYVDDIALHQIGGIGLQIGPNAMYSGPYSNLSFTPREPVTSSCTANQPIGSCPVCVDIEAQTRGVRNATCEGAKIPTNTLGEDVPGAAAIYVNASNNVVENIHIEAFWDGVEVGATPNTVGNVTISGITGTFSFGYVENTVHLCGSNSLVGATFGTCFTSGTLTDVAIFDVTDTNNGDTQGTSRAYSTAIQDDVTGTTVDPAPGTIANGNPSGLTVGMYILGESMGGGYSRLTTNPGTNYTSTLGSPVSTWGVGSAAAGSSCGAGSISGSPKGAVYSNTAGNGGSGSKNSIYVCTTGGSWVPIL